MKTLAKIQEFAHSNNYASLANVAKAAGVDLADIVEYRLCEYMARMGFSYQAISDNTGLTKSQVSARLRRSNPRIRVKDYRDGKNDVGQAIIGKLTDVAQRRFIENMERYLLKG
jgi:hypothetical protein